MSIRRLVLLITAGISAGLLAWALLQTGSSQSAAPRAGAVGSLAGSGTSASAVASAVTGAHTPPASVPVASPPMAPAPVRSGAGSIGAATEVLPSPATASQHITGLPGLHGTPSRNAALIERPLPAAGVRRGDLVTGFPAALRPPAAATTAISSIAGADGVVHVSLTASCSRPCAPLRQYRIRLTALGFAETQVPSAANATTLALLRGEDSVTLTLTGGDDDAESGAGALSYSLFAVLHATGR